MDIEALYFEALLAQAAYADGLEADMTAIELTEKLMAVSGMTTVQAEYFASRYKVVAHQETTESGFSATVFQKISDGSFHFAMRGTDSIVPDFTSANAQNLGYGMSLNQVADMLNFYLASTGAGEIPQYEFKLVLHTDLAAGQKSFDPLNSAYRIVFVNKDPINVSGIVGVDTSSQLSISGHSLGGHLASAFSLLLPQAVDYTTTFNSAGIIGGGFDLFADLISTTVNEDGFITLSPVSNVETVLDIRSPLDPISILGSHLSGSPVNVEIDGELLDAHSIDKLADTLAVANAMNTLDETLDIATYNQFFKLSANDENITLEALTNHLATLFGATNVDVIDSDHDAVYKSLNSITNLASHNSYRFTAIDSGIVAQALSGDKAALYALIKLQPFVVRGTSQGITDALYQNHSANGALDIENFSEQYLADRANMLQWLIKYNEEDIDYQKILSVGELKTFTELSSPLNEGKDLTLNLDKDISDVPDKQIKFGTEYDDGILGADNDDRLYGGAGNDAILGKDGDDYIEGGKGNDTMSGGDGDDTFIVQDSGDTVIELDDEGDDTIYSHVDFTLSDNSYVETIRAVNTDDLQQEVTDNVDLTGNNTNNTLYGNSQDNTLDGGGADDVIFGGEGDDSLIGGEGDGNDYLDGGLGDDTMSGGDGNDIYYVDSRQDTVVEKAGEGKQDIIRTSVSYVLRDQDKYIEQVELDTRNGGSGTNLTGNEYNNRLVGNQLNNILLGGGGHNVIHGGGGNDILYSGEGVSSRTDYDDSAATLKNSTLEGGIGRARSL